MSQDGGVMLNFAGSQYFFRLAIGQWQKLENELGIGPLKILERLGGTDWSSRDVQKVILWGLVGGGLPPTHAAEMVHDFVDPVPLGESWDLACTILNVGFRGSPVEDQNPSKKDSPPEKSKASESMTFPVGDTDGRASTGQAAH